MKSLLKFFGVIIALTIIFAATPQKASAQVSVNFQVFYDDLSPYGQWIDYPSYGYVWVPTFNPLFIPYSTGGHWVYTMYGWTWVSDYHWGWAPFHYGRWDYDDYFGWYWVPGFEWGPAWVLWRTSPGYYGWAPMGPNISIALAIGGGYNVPYDYWTFVPNHYMGRQDINTYYGPRKDNQQIVNNSTVINNTYVDNRSNSTYVSGPRREEVEKTSGRTFKPIPIKENSKPDQSLKNNELILYRPSIVKSEDKNIRPAKIADKKDVKPISERTMQKEENIQPAQEKVPRKEKAEPVKPAEQQPKQVEPKIIKPNQNIVTPEKNVTEPAKRQEQQPKKVEPKIIKPSQEPLVAPPAPKAAPIENKQVPVDKGLQPKPQKPVQQVAPQKPVIVPMEQRNVPPVRTQPNQGPPRQQQIPQQERKGDQKREE